jgi:hypothetical protein
MGKAIQQTQRGSHEAEEKPGPRTCAERKEDLPTALRIGIFPISFSGRRPIVLPRLFRQSSLVKTTSPVRLDPADRLILLRRLDRFRKWQSLDDRRFCRCCHKLISGRQIEVIDATTQDEPSRVACPTTDCPSTVEDWVYPNEIAQPPDKWGRRVIRVVDREGERFILCGNPQAYSRRRLSHRVVFGSRTAA